MNVTRFSIYRKTRDFFTDLSPQRTFIMLLLFSTISVLMWAGISEVDVIVRTEGQIIPAGKSQIVQHLEGGIVRKILVQEGQVVVGGQALMELSDVQTRSNLEQEQSMLDALRGREARLFAEVNGHNKIDFPKELNDPDVISGETAAWKARQAQLAEEIQVLEALSMQKANELTEVNSKQKNLLEELVLVNKKHHVIVGLEKNNAASELEVLDSQMRLQQLKSQISDATNTIPRLQAAQSEAESRVKEAIARFRAEASAALTQVREELGTLSLGIGTSVDRLKQDKGVPHLRVPALEGSLVP